FKTDYMFRSVLLPKGDYTLTFKFHNNYIYLVTVIIHYGLTLLAICLIVLLLKKKKADEQ
ncbi:MAG: hypothetical protein KKH98_05675, partial [Spirochaetes bacterium]|nr:hypothetical protein [Spirochaetota bacterium]